MTTAVEDQAEVFAANRARSRIELTVASADGTTRRSRVLEEGPLRVRFPGPPSGALEAVVVNTAGGIAGGDRLDIDITVGEGAHLTVTTAAAEKIYRSLDPAAAIHLDLRVGANGSLLWLPQETILFDRARLRRTIDLHLDEGATLVLAEALVFDEAIGASLREPAVAGGRSAVATLLMCPADAARIAPVRARADRRGEVAISAWNGFAVARFVAADGAALRYDLMAALSALGVVLPRLWLN